MSIEENNSPVLWRISDNRTGHDSQSEGLVRALNKIKPCDCHDLKLSGNNYRIADLLFKRFPLAEKLPNPDLIIGAGHGTHFPLLGAKRARGGKTVVIMKPSVPLRWFDFCFIPEHDSPKLGSNVLTTKGAINCITSTTEKLSDHGLILIGGPSKHFYWDKDYLLQQIAEILSTHKNINWKISDSTRTPAETSKALASLPTTNAEYKDYSTTSNTWLAEQLRFAANVWVSTDSVSMIYESLTAGASVGLLDIPARRSSKLTNNIVGLVEDDMATPYSKWLADRKLNKPPVQLNEARRCAERLYELGLLG